MSNFNLTDEDEYEDDYEFYEDMDDPEKMYCPNCGTLISCGCQLSTASDGTEVCEDCLIVYEEGLKAGQ